MDSVGGRYVVTTAVSSYLIDLDRQLLKSLSGTGDSEGSLLRRDEVVTLLDVIECSVGRRMILRIDLHALRLPLTARFTTQVVFSIDLVPSPARPTPTNACQTRTVDYD